MDKNFYTVKDVLNVGYELKPLKCIHCNTIGEVSFSQWNQDGYCNKCSKWQLE